MSDPNTEKPQPEESAKAAEAFAAYVGMGYGRSLTSLAHVLVERGWYKTAPTARRVVAKWSNRFRWQERIAAAVTAKTEEALARASEIDATAFLRTSELLSARLMHGDAIPLDHIIRLRESVRRPVPKGGAASVDVNVQVTVTLRDMAERIAAEEGLDADELIAEAERFLRTGV